MTGRTLSRLQTRFAQREAVGVLKYGCTVDRTDLHPVDWLVHMSEELMDACLYAERLRSGMALQTEARSVMVDGTLEERADWCRRFDELFGKTEGDG